MKRLPVLLALLMLHQVANAQFFSNIFNRIYKKASSVFSDEEDYNSTDSAIAPYLNGDLPTTVDFEPYMPPVGNQLPQHSCVAWAVGYGCRSYYVARQTNAKFVANNTIDYTGIVSPAFIYNIMNKGENKPSSLYWALRLLRDTGACSWQSMPYHNYRWKRKPAKWQFAEAQEFRIDIFLRLEKSYLVKNIKAQLATGTPVIVATAYDKTYYNAGFGKKNGYYLWEVLSKAEEEMGHAVLIMGYNDSLQAFKFMNSWGTGWGNRGYGWISYLLAPQVITEAYIIKPKKMSSDFLEKNRSGQNTTDTASDMLSKSSINAVTLLQRIDKTESDVVADSGSVNLYAKEAVLKQCTAHDAHDRCEADIAISGGIYIPAMLCDSFQVVVQFYLERYGGKGPPVFSLDKNYQLANEFAATSTLKQQASDTAAIQSDWEVIIPVNALDLPTGTSVGNGKAANVKTLIAEPVLMADGYSIYTGKYVRFDLKN